jgi:protein-tyrosine phosphatase
VTAIAATPHVRDDYPTTVEAMLEGVALLRDDFAREQIPVEVLTGGELDLERIWELDPDDLPRFTLAGSGRWLLVEMPYTGWPLLFEQKLDALRRLGLEALLAHPERNPEVQANPGLLAPLVESGLRVQLTAASVDGRLGQAPLECAQQLIERGLAHVLASDAHAPAIRETGMSAAVDAIGDARVSRLLTVENPQAIVDGRELR